MDVNQATAIHPGSTTGTAGHPGPVVLLHIGDGLATVTLNRPDKLNALSLGLAKEFRQAVAEVAERDDVGVLLIQGAGSGFCAGGDVGEMAAAADRGDYLAKLVGEMNEPLASLSKLPVVTITAVHGTVAGGGIGLMLAGDIVLAAEGTGFTSAYPGVGLSPDCGASTLLPAVVGLRRALEFTLAGRMLHAEHALEWGLISEVVAPDQLRERAAVVARDILAGAPQALGETRRLLRASVGRGFVEGLQDEIATISMLARTELAGRRIERFAAPWGGAS